MARTTRPIPNPGRLPVLDLTLDDDLQLRTLVPADAPLAARTASAR